MTFERRLQETFRPPVSSVVELFDRLLAAFGDHDAEVVRAGDRCVCRWKDGSGDHEAPVPIPARGFREFLARVAVLCNEWSRESVSPYGGEGELRVGGSGPILRVRFMNTPGQQKLEILRVPTPPAPPVVPSPTLSERASEGGTPQS